MPIKHSELEPGDNVSPQRTTLSEATVTAAVIATFAGVENDAHEGVATVESDAERTRRAAGVDSEQS